MLDKNVIWEGRPSANPHGVRIFVMLLIGIVCELIAFSGEEDFVGFSLLLLGGIAFFMSVVYLLSFVIPLLSERYTLLSDRLVLKGGIVNEWTAEMPLRELSSVNISTGLFARMYGLGNLTILYSPSDKSLTIRDVKEPEEVKRLIEEAYATTKKGSQ